MSRSRFKLIDPEFDQEVKIFSTEKALRWKDALKIRF